MCTTLGQGYSRSPLQRVQCVSGHIPKSYNNLGYWIIKIMGDFGVAQKFTLNLALHKPIKTKVQDSDSERRRESDVVVVVLLPHLPPRLLVVGIKRGPLLLGEHVRRQSRFLALWGVLFITWIKVGAGIAMVTELCNSNKSKNIATSPVNLTRFASLEAIFQMKMQHML